MSKTQEEKEQEEQKKDKKGEQTEEATKMLEKMRELEAQNKELSEKLAQVSSNPQKKDGEKAGEGEEDEDDFFNWGEDTNEEEKKKKIEESVAHLIEEKIKPLKEAEKERLEKEKEKARSRFYKEHSEYLTDSAKWQKLLDTLDSELNPNVGSPYEQLEKAHYILNGGKMTEAMIAQAKERLAQEANAGDGGSGKAPKADPAELSAEEKKEAAMYGVSEEGMKAYKKQLSDKSLILFSNYN